MTARLVAAVMAIAMCGLANAATINVPEDYPTIQEAIDASQDGDEILVAPGTYTPTGSSNVINLLGKPITIRATGTAEETILDGEGTSTVVRCASGEGAGTIIEGFTITEGFGYSSGYGGGIFCVGSSPTIKNCMITNNTAPNAIGGGIYCNSSSPTISGCTISDNTESGIACYGSSPTITGCTISGNTDRGIYCNNSHATITGCTITGNTASDGGGIYCFGSDSPTITDCTISDNTATGSGGGIKCSKSNVTITGCTIENNSAGLYGGGISFYIGSPTITDCTISGNTASDGGGIFTGGSYLALLNSAVCGNSPNQIVGSYSDEGGNTVAAACPIPGACCTNGECVIAEQADCLAFHGTWLGEGTTCDDSPCPIACLGDVTGDGQVSVNDVLTVIGNWGPCP